MKKSVSVSTIAISASLLAACGDDTQNANKCRDAVVNGFNPSQVISCKGFDVFRTGGVIDQSIVDRTDEDRRRQQATGVAVYQNGRPIASTPSWNHSDYVNNPTRYPNLTRPSIASPVTVTTSHPSGITSSVSSKSTGSFGSVGHAASGGSSS